MTGEVRTPRSLRPRSVLGVVDAAFELTATSPAVAGLALLGAGPLAVASLALWYGASEGILDAASMRLLAAATAAATLWRAIPAGAVAHLVAGGLAGRPVDAGAALAAALRRGPSLMAAQGLVLGVAALSSVLLMVPLVAWSGVFAAAPLVMARESAPWALVAGARRVLGERSLAAGGLTALWLLGVIVLALNLWLAIVVGLLLARSLFDLDTAWAARVLSPENAVFLPALLALALVLLEPIRQSSLALLLADAQVRREALDLKAAMAALPVRRRSRARALGLMALLLLPGGPSAAQSPSSDPGARLESVALEAEAAGEEVDRGALAAALEALQGPSSEDLEALVEQLETDLAEGRPDVAAARLAVAISEMNVLGAPAQDPLDLEALTAAVLARPEFAQARPRPARATSETGWWTRLLEWLAELLQGLDREVPAKDPATGFGSGASWLWAAALVLVLLLSALAVVRSLGGGASRVPGREPPPEEAARTPRAPCVEDALSRPPDGWLAEADLAAARGEWREAVRLTYLALLSALHRAQAIDYSPTRTNWDHVRGFRGEGASRTLLEDLTLQFELAWYGLRPPGAEGFHRVRREALALVAAVGGGALA